MIARRVLLIVTAALLLAAGGCEQKKDEPKSETTAKPATAESTTEAPAADPHADHEAPSAEQPQPGADEAPTAAEQPAEHGGEHGADHAPTDTAQAEPGDGAVDVVRAIGVLVPTEGSEVRGTITFEMADGGVVVKGQITGLTPGEHGFHVHEWGDCSAPDATSAGSHFNPTSAQHGAPGAEQHHLGDLGNVTAGEDGVATVETTHRFLQLSGPQSIVGRGLIVHEKADDLTTQPTGDAGGRVACAVIGVAKPAQ